MSIPSTDVRYLKMEIDWNLTKDLLQFYFELEELPQHGIWVSQPFMKHFEHHHTHVNRNIEYNEQLECIKDALRKLCKYDEKSFSTDAAIERIKKFIDDSFENDTSEYENDISIDVKNLNEFNELQRELKNAEETIDYWRDNVLKRSKEENESHLITPQWKKGV